MNLRSRNKVNASFSMSSMTDMVFLLLIFFIILSTLVNTYSLPVDLPTGDNKSLEKQNTSVTIQADLTHFVNNELVEVRNVEKQLRKLAQDKEVLKIKLAVDKTVPHEHMLNVVEIAKRNKWEILVSTKP